MFESKNFESIMSNMLSYIYQSNPDIDIRPGSMIYTALAPIALELETAYHEMDMILEETFVETASKEYLVKHGDQIGVNLNEASYARFIGEFNVDVGDGCRFTLDKFNYSTVTKMSDPTDENSNYTYVVICETPGSEPNSYLGELTPIDYVEDLAHAELTSVLIYGEDEEDTEAFRYRIQTSVKNPPNDGNVYRYQELLDYYDGVGKYEIIPCWNGVNTVKLNILNSENNVASSEFIKEVQKYFDPPTGEIIDDKANDTYPQGRGMGNGIASIGAIVTVSTASEVPVIINCKATLNDGYTTIQDAQDFVEDYFKSIVFTNTPIGYLPIWSAIYNAPSVKNIESLSVTVKGIIMDMNATSFVNTVDMGEEELAVLDTENSVWGD